MEEIDLKINLILIDKYIKQLVTDLERESANIGFEFAEKYGLFGAEYAKRIQDLLDHTSANIKTLNYTFSYLSNFSKKQLVCNRHEMPPKHSNVIITKILNFG